MKNEKKPGFFAVLGGALLHNLPFLAAGIVALIVGHFLSRTVFYIGICLTVAFFLSTAIDAAYTGAASGKMFAEREDEEKKDG